jgi:predicted nucleotidyltransferase
MSENEVLNTIKATVHSFLPDARVMLFGSHAKGTSNKHSDYDILIITKDTIPLLEKRDIKGKIGWALVRSIHAPFDLICHSQEEVDVYKNYYGHIVRYAMQEAVEL